MSRRRRILRRVSRGLIVHGVYLPGRTNAQSRPNACTKSLAAVPPDMTMWDPFLRDSSTCRSRMSSLRRIMTGVDGRGDGLSILGRFR
jgi:hypothetical protein